MQTQNSPEGVTRHPALALCIHGEEVSKLISCCYLVLVKKSFTKTLPPSNQISDKHRGYPLREPGNLN